jgi:ribosome-associated protein YbcJ (S4-like RNA binding protein)
MHVDQFVYQMKDFLKLFRIVEFGGEIRSLRYK